MVILLLVRIFDSSSVYLRKHQVLRISHIHNRASLQRKASSKVTDGQLHVWLIFFKLSITVMLMLILCICNLNAPLMNACRGWSAVLANIVNTNCSYSHTWPPLTPLRHVSSANKRAETCYRDQLTTNTDWLIISLLKFAISLIWCDAVAILQMEKFHVSIICMSKFKSLCVVFWIVLMLYHWHVLEWKSCLKCQGYNCSMAPAASCWLPSYFLEQCPAAYQQVFIINES